MSEREERLRRAVSREMKSRWFIASFHRHVVFTSRLGYVFSFYVTKGLWFKMRIFIEDEIESRINPDNYKIIEFLCLDNMFSEAYMYDKINLLKYLFDYDMGSKLTRNHITTPPHKEQIRRAVNQYIRKPLPYDWANDMDRYLKRGDIVACAFVTVLEHTGVYMGDGVVIHMSGHGGGKREGKVRRGQLIGNFVSKSTDPLCIWKPYVQTRTVDQVCEEAERWLETQVGNYHLLLNNCQNFIWRCERWPTKEEEEIMNKSKPQT